MDRRAGGQERGWDPKHDPRLIRNGRRPMRGSRGIDTVYYVPDQKTKNAVENDMARYGRSTDIGVEVLPRGSSASYPPPCIEPGAAVVGAIGSIRRALREAFTKQIGRVHVDGNQVTFTGLAPTRVGREPASRLPQPGVSPQVEPTTSPGARGLAGAGNRLTPELISPRWTPSQPGQTSPQEAYRPRRSGQDSRPGSAPAPWPPPDSHVPPGLFVRGRNTPK